MSPFAYIMECRLEKARAMLRQNRESSITEIGQARGFPTTSYFGKCFREKHGLSPGAAARVTRQHPARAYCHWPSISRIQAYTSIS